jgi:hypothetical protein
LKTVELSCLNLAANCIDTVNADVRRFHLDRSRVLTKARPDYQQRLEHQFLCRRNYLLWCMDVSSLMITDILITHLRIGW